MLKNKMLMKTNAYEILDYFKTNLNERFNEFNERDYAYIYGIGDVDIQIGKYNPIKGSSYSELPEKIKNSKSIINIKNTDNKCFLWSVIAYFHKPREHAERVSNYEKYVNEFIYNDTNFLL